MPNMEDYLSDMGFGGRKAKTKPMWGEVIPKMEEGDNGTGIMGIVGKLAKIGGTVANLVPGGQVVGVPMTVAGGALEGGDKGGITGALKGGAISGAGAAASAGLGSVAESLKTPVDTGDMTAFSSSGNPFTVPGVRTNLTEVFSSQGSPMTVPASPKAFGGGS